MARYTGPRVRISRRFGIPIFGPSKYLERRNYGPGVHGPKSGRRKTTDYGLGLIEKQKLRYYYGLMEKQFRGVYEKALRHRLRLHVKGIADSRTTVSIERNVFRRERILFVDKDEPVTATDTTVEKSVLDAIGKAL